jgi:pimeloyl-ACP methyl ester carboxylesterase
MIGERPLPAPAGILAALAGDRVAPSHNVRGWLRACGALAALAGFAYLLLLAWVYHHQERLIFRPAPLPATHRFALADVHEVAIPVAGATLSALHLRLPNPRGLIFFLHGNSGNAADWLTSTDFYRAANYDLLLLDYRGYGKSGGRIESEEQLRADVRAAWQAVAPAYAGRRTVIYGRSLGTALAAGLAAEVQPDLTILVSPYCSMQQLMRQHHPLLPPALLRYPLATCADAVRIDGPLLLVHGDRDRLIPIAHSEQLAATVPHARLLRLADAAHADVHEFPAYGSELMRTLQALPTNPSEEYD